MSIGVGVLCEAYVGVSFRSSSSVFRALIFHVVLLDCFLHVHVGGPNG